MVIAIIHRCPDDSSITDKMIYASTKHNLKKSIPGLNIEFQTNDQGDFDYVNLADMIEQKCY